jgi:putative transposase
VLAEVFDTAREQALDDLSSLIGRTGACTALGINRPTWYRHHRSTPAPPRPRREPAAHPAKLSVAEEEQVLAVLRGERFVDVAPAEVWATLLDEGTYLCSESTMYRLLRRTGEVKERRRQSTHPPRKKPELEATASNQVWSWDVTVLPGPDKRVKYFLYSMIDIWSRYTVAWMVADAESEGLSGQFIASAYEKQGVGPGEVTLHADRGAIQTARSVAVLMADLGVTKSHSRPKTSNDNPYSEAHFKTLKYRPDYPRRFGSIQDAKAWCAEFFDWYHFAHRHSGIGLHTPFDVHHGLADTVRDKRAFVLTEAYQRHPERFVHKPPRPPNIPQTAWINRPPPKDETATTIPTHS